YFCFFPFVVRANRSLAGCPAERGSGGAHWETPKRLGAARFCRPAHAAVNTHFCVLVGLLPRALKRSRTLNPWIVLTAGKVSTVSSQCSIRLTKWNDACNRTT